MDNFFVVDNQSQYNIPDEEPVAESIIDQSFTEQTPAPTQTYPEADTSNLLIQPTEEPL